MDIDFFERVVWDYVYIIVYYIVFVCGLCMKSYLFFGICIFGVNYGYS